MSPETAKGKFIYYSCTNAKKDLCDKKIYIPEKDFLKPIYKLLEAFESIPQAKIDEIVEGLKKSNEGKDLYHKEAIRALQQEYNTIQVRLSRLTDLLLDQSITKDIYDKKHEEYRDQIQVLEIELSEHTKADYDYQTTIATVISVARRAKTIFDQSSDPAKKRAFLNYLLQNPTVNGKKLEFSIASPFNLVLELASRPNLLRG